MNEFATPPAAITTPLANFSMSLSPNQEDIAKNLQGWLSNHPSPLAKALAQGMGGSFQESEMRILEQEIIKKFIPLPEAEKYLKVLCKMVDAINASSPDKLPAPRIPLLSARPKNPFVGILPEAMQQARLWRETTKKLITQKYLNPSETPSPLSPKASIGLLFSSAILHGGLVDSDLLVSLARALDSPKDTLALYAQRLSVELSISWQGESNSEYRLWYPDALTGTLISKLEDGVISAWMSGNTKPVESDKDIRALLWSSIAAFFKQSRPAQARPTSLGALLEAAKGDLFTRIPPVLMSYSSRKLVSHSPGRHVLNRLHQISMPSTPSLPQRRHESTDVITTLNFHSEDLNDLEPVWLGKLRQAFKGQIRGQVISNLAKTSPQNGSPEALYHGFAMHLVSGLSGSGKRLALTTAKSYLVTVAKNLGGRLGNVSPAALQREILEDLYAEILEDASQDGSTRGLRRHHARALGEFHSFLVREHQLEAINNRSVLGIGKGLVPVDANLITYDEYEAIHNALPATLRSLHPTLPSIDTLGKAAQLLFMLAFKCGLRRMEALMLKCNDFAEHHPAELLIRPSDARQLKTKSSTRKLPLYALLDDSELLALRTWKASRLKDFPGKTASEVFLFALPELGNAVITQDQIFPVIHEAMRKAAGDETLRFHHLRHSFASWTFMRLMLSDLNAFPVLFPHHLQTTAVLSRSKEFRHQLYGRDDPTRRHTYAVASLLGHSGPDVSLEHYIHVCDLLFMLWRDQDVSAPATKPLKLEASRPKSTFYRWIEDDPSQVPFRLLKKNHGFSKKFRRTHARQNATITGLSPVTSTSVNLEPAIFQKVWNLLFEHSFHGRPLEEVSLEAGLPLDAAQKMLKAAQDISDQRISRGSKGFQHRMKEMNFDRRNKAKFIRIPCPEEPRTQPDKAIAADLAEKLSELIKNQPDLCKSVFDYYIENAWNDRNHLPFKDPENPQPARDFIQFLAELGISKTSLQMLSYDPSERSRNTVAWKKTLQLPKDYPIRKIEAPGNTSVKSRKWIAIKPVFDTGVLDDSASIAFRYLMVMGAIVTAGIY